MKILNNANLFLVMQAMLTKATTNFSTEHNLLQIYGKNRHSK